jgi:Zn-ribbon-containing, possibly nucleic-acid-binding protein (DUF2310)
MTNDPYWQLRPQPATPPDEICECDSATPIVLQSHLSPNPLSCARCNLEVPPERIGLDAPLAETLAAWRRFHEAFDTLWLDSGEYEEWAAAQLGDPASAVNVRGLALARRLTKWRRCYLGWFRPDPEEGAEPNGCPRCSGLLEPRFIGERPQRGGLLICEACAIAIAV